MTDLLPTVLNEAAKERLGRDEGGSTRSPLQVMTSIRPPRALIQVVPDRTNIGCKQLGMKGTRAEHLARIDRIKSSLWKLHKDIEGQIGK